MYLVDYEKDLETERLVTDDPIIAVQDILAQAPSYRPLLIRIERVPVKLNRQTA